MIQEGVFSTRRHNGNVLGGGEKNNFERNIEQFQIRKGVQKQNEF